MAKREYTVIQLPEWGGWRVAGSDTDWQVQTLKRRKDGDSWEGTNFFPSLEFAIAKAYERALRESGADIESGEQLVAECRRVKDELAKAVRRAAKQ